MPPRHADTVQLSKAAGAVLREMGELGILTDANVAASNTKDALKTTISTAVAALTTHGEVAPQEDGFVKTVDTLYAIGDVTDVSLAACTSLADLIALTASDNTSFRKTSLIA